MPQFYADGSAVARVVTKVMVIAAIAIGVSEMALAADHVISAQTPRFECKSIKPGETVTLASGTRGPLVIQNCNGTSANPIIVRNDPNGSGPTIIRRTGGSSGGFVFNCSNCIGVEIDGSYKWRGAPASKTYGIKVTMTGGAEPSAFLRIGGRSRFVTVRNVEVAGVFPALASQGTGIWVNDESIKRSQNPGLWREGILIEDNYVHNVSVAGMYVGANYSVGSLPLRNIEIRYNRIEDIGWEGINTKSMWAGDNSIHHNVIRRVGLNGKYTSKSSQYSGITNNSGTVEIYNNWIEKTGMHGIQVWTSEGPKESEGLGPFEANIWNNVIVDAGGLWRPFMGSSFGISIGAQNGCEKPIPHVYNNTIVDARESAISLRNDVGAGFVRDNLVAGPSISPIHAPSFISVINNRVGSTSQISFVNPALQNFRLNANSPARNQGSNVFPPIDFDDVTRPKDGAPDQGAFEGSTGGG